MAVIDLAAAGPHLSQLVDRVEGGDTIVITREGKAVARLTGVLRPRKQIDGAQLRAFTASLPALRVDAATLVRSMRDEDRH